jgi:hypothetical protein
VSCDNAEVMRLYVGATCGYRMWVQRVVIVRGCNVWLLSVL